MFSADLWVISTTYLDATIILKLLIKKYSAVCKTLRTLSKINEMKINGIDKLIFGMKQKDVTAIYGKPDRNYRWGW
jgi:hypothetical protein